MEELEDIPRKLETKVSQDLTYVDKLSFKKPKIVRPHVEIEEDLDELNLDNAILAKLRKR